VQDQGRTDAAFNIEPMGLGDALLAALDDQALALDDDLLSREDGLKDGIYTVRLLSAPQGRIGGSRCRSFPDRRELWLVRISVRLESARPAGASRWRILVTQTPPEVVAGAAVDWCSLLDVIPAYSY